MASLPVVKSAQFAKKTVFNAKLHMVLNQIYQTSMKKVLKTSQMCLNLSKEVFFKPI